MAHPKVILSGFADEAAHSKTPTEQLAVLAGLGMKYYSLRFVDMGDGVKNLMKLTVPEINHLKKLHDAFGIRVSSIGSPIGKVKLRDVEDGTNNAFVPLDRYLKRDVAKAIDMAHRFDCRLIRGFSFYPPKGQNPWDHVQEAAEKLGSIAEACQKANLLYGLEVEANLVGQSGPLQAELARRVNNAHMVLIFDGANIAVHGKTPDEIFRDYRAMLPWLGWIHVKDYVVSRKLRFRGHVNEDMLKQFVPCDRGGSGYERIFRDLKPRLPGIATRLKRFDIPGFFVDLEPHLKGGGQFGGFSGPDGFGVAMRSLCRVLDFVGIEYDLTGYEDIETWKRRK